MKIREYKSADCLETMRLFFDTVHTVNRADYTQEQLDAWAPEDRQADARGAGAEKVTTHASITAKPFFRKRGYRVVKEQQVERPAGVPPRRVKLTNYVMEKDN